MRGFREFAFGLIAVAFISIGGCLSLSTTGDTGGQGGFGATTSGTGLGASGQPCMSVQDCPPVTICTTMSCTDGSCVAGLVKSGTPCQAEGVCDGDGSCVECIFDSDCNVNNASCENNKCVSCSDGQKNGSETGIDCGGPDCAPCGAVACMSANDCAMGLYCVDGYCCDAPCVDQCKACNLTGKFGKCSNLPKGTEDPGVCEAPKACSGYNAQCLLKNGEMCTQDAQCISDFCVSGICQP